MRHIGVNRPPSDPRAGATGSRAQQTMVIGRSDQRQNPALNAGSHVSKQCLDVVCRSPSRPAVNGRDKGRTHDRSRSASQITPNPLRSGCRSLNAPPLSTAFCCSVLPCRGHGSLRGRRWPPQHLVRSTGAAMSTTGSHGNQAAQRPPSQPSCTLAPVGNPSPRRRMTRVDLVRVLSCQLVAPTSERPHPSARCCAGSRTAFWPTPHALCRDRIASRSPAPSLSGWRRA